MWKPAGKAFLHLPPPQKKKNTFFKLNNLAEQKSRLQASFPSLALFSLDSEKNQVIFLANTRTEKIPATFWMCTLCLVGEQQVFFPPCEQGLPVNQICCLALLSQDFPASLYGVTLVFLFPSWGPSKVIHIELPSSQRSCEERSETSHSREALWRRENSKTALYGFQGGGWGCLNQCFSKQHTLNEHFLFLRQRYKLMEFAALPNAR